MFAGPDKGEDADEEIIATPTRRFSLLEITSGLPDDSREEDEREEARRIRDLHGRVKAARAVVAKTPGLAETLSCDWRRGARFCVRLGVIERQFRSGVPSERFAAADGKIALPRGFLRTPSGSVESLRLVRLLWQPNGR